ncbi:hypothetical protein [Laspinema palackyanum]
MHRSVKTHTLKGGAIRTKPAYPGYPSGGVSGFEQAIADRL